MKLLGVAGNKRRLPGQPAWAFIDDELTWDEQANLSGIVAHGLDFPHRTLSIFGESCQEVKLLDGVFLACRSEVLKTNNLKFDERFDFHFYDIDFCRSAEEQNVSMGTCSISIVHESEGSFGSSSWIKNRDKYFSKWGKS